jgi:hypothetical protein
MSLDAVVDESRNTLCHSLFNDARNALVDGDKQTACNILRSIAQMPGIESRYQIQGWHLYRLVGGQPNTALAKLVMGVIVEVGVDKGDDLLAVYADRTAHYHNHTGSGVVWKRPDDSLDKLMDPVLEEAATIVTKIGPWEGKRRPPPQQGYMRLSILTPSGVHFGEGPFDLLARDKIAKRLVLAATSVMVRLTALAFGSGDLIPPN